VVLYINPASTVNVPSVIPYVLVNPSSPPGGPMGDAMPQNLFEAAPPQSSALPDTVPISDAMLADLLARADEQFHCANEPATEALAWLDAKLETGVS
jgi:hypothetical protein